MKNKYSGLSDGKINKLVAEKLGFGVLSINDINYYAQVTKDCKYYLVNYCFDYSDAFKLMIDSEMTLEKNIIANKWIARSRVFNDKNDMVKVVSSINENPCRAIAECFLLMKDAENKDE